jgi:hypothetical protein
VISIGLNRSALSSVGSQIICSSSSDTLSSILKVEESWLYHEARPIVPVDIWYRYGTLHEHGGGRIAFFASQLLLLRALFRCFWGQLVWPKILADWAYP